MPPKYYPPRIPPTPIEPDYDPNKTPTKSMYTAKKKSTRSSSISRARSPIPRIRSPVPRVGSPLPRVVSPVSRPKSTTLRAVKIHERTSVRNFFTQVEPTPIQPKTEPTEQELQYPPLFIRGTSTESEAKPQAQMDASVSYWRDRVRRAVDQKTLETDMFIAQIRVEKLEQERERAQKELERLREKRNLMDRGGQV